MASVSEDKLTDESEAETGTEEDDELYNEDESSMNALDGAKKKKKKKKASWLVAAGDGWCILDQLLELFKPPAEEEKRH